MKIIERAKDESKSISSVEALMIVERIRMERGMENNEAFQGILKYLRTCPSPRNPSWAERVRRTLVNAGISDYEASLIINLSPERHTDAKALIPSLNRIDNYALDILLNEIAEIPTN
ncbi:DNA-directed RNA polymerase II subunit RPB4 [Nematocida minor]|uniref:DNA-directed RNA polymerase II subunit RPB4 n=1 Tax=Nematocida minor TaxID=1912983 RepID=UPI00221FC6AA|nr:DNA-directed RNA polymerase II subunit RPB4 [Nematocida minor]KAI5193224.1 DNA-directed RNA polymerase II subunit RPB4 [Nematocida minor]